MVIRTGTLADAETLARFAEQTFRDAFAADNQPDDMEAYCAAKLRLFTELIAPHGAAVIAVDHAHSDDWKIGARDSPPRQRH